MRRTFWMVVGAGLGAWMVVRLQRAAAQLTPSGAAAAARRHVRHLRSDLSAALAEGRRAKQATEHELLQAAHSRPAIDATSVRAGPAGDAGHLGLAAGNAAEEMRAHR